MFERHNKSFERVIKLLKQVTNLCERHNKSFKRVIILFEQDK